MYKLQGSYGKQYLNDRLFPVLINLNILGRLNETIFNTGYICLRSCIRYFCEFPETYIRTKCLVIPTYSFRFT